MSAEVGTTIRGSGVCNIDHVSGHVWLFYVSHLSLCWVLNTATAILSHFYFYTQQKIVLAIINITSYKSHRPGKHGTERMPINIKRMLKL